MTMENINLNEEKYERKELSFSDEETSEWLQSRANAIAPLMVYYIGAMREVETKFKVLDDVFSFKYDRNPINSIKTRLKSPKSIFEKLKARGLPLSPESIEKNLNDVAGVRVICALPQDVYDLSDMFLKQDDITLIAKKDYIKNPKPNGYRSLHLIIEIPIFLTDEKKNMRVEIQFRTIAMDFWASVEHQLRYKKNVEFTKEMADELLECAELSAQLDLRMDNLRKCLQ